MQHIHTVAMHVKPHLDEILALFIAGSYGTQVWTGIAQAKIVYWGAGTALPDGKSSEQYEQEGYLLLGIGGGRFDDHKEKKRKASSATLVAKFLGIENQPEISLLLAYNEKSDKGNDNAIGFAYMIKIAQRYSGNEPGAVINWAYNILADYLDFKQGLGLAEKPGMDFLHVMTRYLKEVYGSDLSESEMKWDDPIRLIEMLMSKNKLELSQLYEYLTKTRENGNSCSLDFDLRRVADWIRSIRPDEVYEDIAFFLDAYLREQYIFHHHAKPVIEKKGVWREIDAVGRKIKLLVVRTDLAVVDSYARTYFGADIVVVQNKSGNVQIFSKKYKRFRMDDVASVLRYEEQIRREGRAEITEWETLRSEGMLPEHPYWYYEKGPRWVMNGSISHPDVPPTKIKLNNIVKMVETALNPNSCKQAGCTKGKCWLYRYGFSFCRRKRFQAARQQKQEQSKKAEKAQKEAADS